MEFAEKWLKGILFKQKKWVVSDTEQNSFTLAQDIAASTVKETFDEMKGTITCARRQQL